MYPGIKFEKSTESESETLIVTFCSLSGTYKEPPVFEFTNFLRKVSYNSDRLFFIDYTRSWYQYGVSDVSENIQDFINYLRDFIKGYKYVVFMGISSGGYAAILFGSILNVDTVIGLVPQTLLKDEVCMNTYDSKYTSEHPYKDLKEVINHQTKYVLVCADNIEGTDDIHGNGHCLRLGKTDNIEIKMIYWETDILIRYRDEGLLKEIIFPHLNMPL